MRKNIFSIILFIFIFTLSACNANPQSAQEDISVLATTSIVYDIVQNIAGDHITVDSLLPIGADPHSFSPTPQDLAKLSDSDLVFANGAGLEIFLEDMIENAGAEKNVIYLSDSNELITSDHEDDHGDDHDEDHDEEEADHDHGENDPHLWTSPKNVIQWIPVIAAQLSELDPTNAESYQVNAQAYLSELNELDQWVTDSVNTIPADHRKLITDHLLFAYFCRDYDFEQIGSVYSSTSTLAEPSAQEMAALEEIITHEGVNAIFVGNTVSPELSERVSEDTGAQLYFFYSGSLSDQDGDASTYLDYIKYNVSTFVDALK